MTIIPAVSYFVLLVWATEIKKTLRASSFLRNVSEPRISQMFPNADYQPLTWERVGYTYGRVTTYYLAIAAALVSFALIAFAVGAFQFERLSGHAHGWLWSGWWPISFGCLVIAVPVSAIRHYVRHETSLNFGERNALPPASTEGQEQHLAPAGPAKD